MTSTSKRASPADNNAHAPRASASAPTKRRRTAHACDSCRTRKSRCDGARPICDICTAMGLDCHYRGPAKQQPHSAFTSDHVSRLEGRLQAVEHLLRQQQMAVATDGSPQPSVTRDTGSLDYSWEDVQNDMGFSDQAARANPDEIPDTADDDVDGLAIISFRDEEGSGYFGPTSNYAFFIQTMTAVASFTKSRWVLPSSASGIGAEAIAISRPTSPPPQTKRRNPLFTRPSSSPYTLPLHDEMAGLVDVFFSNTGKMFPYLCKKSVLQILQTIGESGTQSLKRSSLCLINTVMALATVYGREKTPTPDMVLDGNVFMERALALLPNGTPQSANLESLQCLLLILQYVQSSKGSTQIWGLHGAAMSLSLQLGMQRQTQAGNSLQDVISNRVWWMCLLMDSLQHDPRKTPLIPNSYMQALLPKDVELDQLECGNEAPTELTVGQPTTSTGIFIQTLKLYLIVGNIIEKIYDQNLDNTTKQSASHLFKSVLEIEESLLEWKACLPVDVRIISKADLDIVYSNSGPLPSNIILSLRYFNTRALLHREVFSRLLLTSANLTPGSGPNIEREMLLEFAPKSLDICLESAVTSINIISRCISCEELLPAWWFSIYYVFNSALIIFGALVCLRIHKLQYRYYTPSRLLKSLYAAFEALQELGQGTRLGIRSLKVLKVIMQIASSLAAGHDIEFPIEATVGLAQHNRMSSNSAGTSTADIDMRTMSGQALSEQAFSTFDFAGMETIFTPSWLNDSQQLFA
ncbi:fungal-specific transcription factor domain-containing protein [Halenospora varia]|nr:fungal-specific transcription factor domain-containing protein [Halenospora varia]